MKLFADHSMINEAMDNVHFVVALQDAQGRFRYGNKFFKKKFQLENSDFIGKKLGEINGLNDHNSHILQQINIFIQAAINKKRADSQRIQSDLTNNALQIELSPIFKNGKIESVLIIAHSIVREEIEQDWEILKQEQALFFKDTLLKLSHYSGSIERYIKFSLKKLSTSLSFKSGTFWRHESDTNRLILKRSFPKENYSSSYKTDVDLTLDMKLTEFMKSGERNARIECSELNEKGKNELYWICKIFKGSDTWALIVLKFNASRGFLDHEESKFLEDAIQVVNAKAYQYQLIEQSSTKLGLSIPMITISDKGKIIHYNTASENILNFWNATKILQAPTVITERILGCLKHDLMERFEETMNDIEYSISITPNKNIGICTLLFYEISEIRERAEEQRLAAAKLQRERANAIIEAVENDRERISQDLHDNIGQLLTSCKLQLDIFEMKEGLAQYPTLSKLKKTLQLAISETRAVARNFMPNSITEYGIILSLQELCANSLLSNGIPFQFKFTGKNLTPSPIVMVTMYRIAQELITNCQKHSDATKAEIAVELDQLSKKIVMTCSDNGKGFSLDMQTNGLGLSNMQNRLNFINGSMSIEKVPSWCKVQVTIPYESKRKS